ncbi:MAG: tetratricopeptide repeat protein [Bacteroidales bacterium]|nr:tetratricopeptide repeat protein [Bacteroidales bacterium]
MFFILGGITYSLIWKEDMNIIKNIFKKESKQQSVQSKTTEEMRADPNLIQIFDEYGQEMFIDKETWRKDVLPGNIKNNWGNPDELYGTIITALNDGFYPDVLKAAHQLYKIDTYPNRGACMLGIVLMKNVKLDEAETILNNYNKKYGEEGVILTNIAKVQAERGQHDISEKTLWHALEVDPNQDNAVEWWAAIHNDRNGQAGYIEALEKVAALNGSWRAQLWLARTSLERQEYEKAREYYNNIITILKVMPSDVMMQISGDLGNAGRLHDIVELCGPRFDPELHGLMPGNNLMKAYIGLKDPENARTILNKLYKLKRPDWKEHLQFWENEIDQATGKFGPVDKDNKITITTLSLSWPIWAHKLSSFEKLLPVKKDDAPTVAFIASSCEYEKMSDQINRQKTDKEGSLGRAIPLYLAEQIHMVTDAKTIMLVPVITGEGSFVVIGKPWEKDKLTEMASSSETDFILGGHLIAKGAEWQFHGTFIDVSHNNVLEEFVATISEKDPGKDTIKLSKIVRHLISKHCKLEKEVTPIKYQLPKPELFNFYLDAISQSLALSTATTDDSHGNSLYGERSILDFLLDLALKDTNSDIARLMFVGALAKNKAYGSSIYTEYQKKVKKLLKDYPLYGTAAEVCSDTIESLYPNNLGAR